MVATGAPNFCVAQSQVGVVAGYSSAKLWRLVLAHPSNQSALTNVSYHQPQQVNCQHPACQPSHKQHASRIQRPQITPPAYSMIHPDAHAYLCSLVSGRNNHAIDRLQMHGSEICLIKALQCHHRIQVNPPHIWQAFLNMCTHTSNSWLPTSS